MRRRTVLAGVAAAALSGGCLGYASEEAAARTLDRLRERTERVESVSGRVSSEAVVDGRRTESETVDVWSLPGRKLRIETGGPDGSQLIVDGSETWLYDPESNRAVHLPFAVEGADPVTPRPIVDELDRYRVEHRGREEIAGREADYLDCTGVNADDGPSLEYYGFRIAPELDRDLVPDRIELWVDGEYGYPLARTVHAGDGRATSAFEDVAFGREIPDEQFAFEPPPDAEVSDDADALANRHESIGRAEISAGFRANVPERIDGHALEYASVAYYEDGTSITAYFEGEGGRVSVRVQPTERPNAAGGETVSVDGVESTVGRIRTIESGASGRALVTNRFRCDGRTYVVNGPSHRVVSTVVDAINCA